MDNVCGVHFNVLTNYGYCELCAAYRTVEAKDQQIRELEAQLEQQQIRVSVKPDGQVWVVFNAGEGRKATLNLNNIVLAKESVGITKGIMLDAIAKALEEVKCE